jgi:hypothetical protein
MTDSIPDRRHIAIACTLDDAQAGERLDQWREILTGLVIHRERPRPQQLRLNLGDHPTGIGDVVSLARSEKACCSFIDFSLDIDADAVTLVIDVAAGFEATLDDLMRLAPDHPTLTDHRHDQSGW